MGLPDQVEEEEVGVEEVGLRDQVEEEVGVGLLHQVVEEVEEDPRGSPPCGSRRCPCPRRHGPRPQGGRRSPCL